MLASEVVNRARSMLADTDATEYRWTTVQLLDYVNDAARHLVQCRPDIMLAAAGTLGVLSTVTAVGNEVGIGSEWTEGLAHYVASRAITEDDADKANADKAARHLTLFYKAVYGAVET